MIGTRCSLLFGLAGLCAWTAAQANVTAGAAPQAVEARVDARELPRKLLHAQADFPVRPGRQSFYYPRWLPGTHAPGGPVQNLAELRFETASGQPLDWTRDPTDPYRFWFDVPERQERLVVRTTYICNQPSVNSESADCFGNSLLGVINWNTLLLYPEGASVAELPVRLELVLPDGWRFGTALPVRERDEASVRFETVDFERLVDSPLICGKHFRTVRLEAPDVKVPHFLHMAAESETALQLPDEVLAAYHRLVGEAGALFGRFPYESYHFLLTLSDAAGRMGLEHFDSSLNGILEREIEDEKSRGRWPAIVLPHELAHAWCGKWRRPEGMATADYHTPARTELLWIYEGLTSYLGSLLAVRSGLQTPDDYREARARQWAYLMSQKGRRWRPLEDTASASHLLRAPSANWQMRRRGQDYYAEGAALWMEADAWIRQSTGGERSLDEFCRVFLGANGRGRRVYPFTLADVEAALDQVSARDWRAFFAQRVQRTQDELPLDFIALLGYRLQYGPKRSEWRRVSEELWQSWSFFESLGLSVNEEGTITGLVPETPADRAGLHEGVKVLGVNDRKFSFQRMEEAVAGSVTSRSVKLLLAEGDVLREVQLPYAEGPRFLEVVRDEARPDLLSAMIRPRVKSESGTEEARPQ